MKQLESQIAVVTGAGRGIGRAISLALAGNGATVALASRSKQELDRVAAECRDLGSDATSLVTDMTDENQVRNLIDKTVESYGRVDILVNNAGIGHFSNVVDMDVSSFDDMWNVNLRGVFLACKFALPKMIGADSGCIVNIGSLAGKNSVKGGAGYAATKWGLRGFASSLMLEVRDHHIRVVTIFPGSVDTSFSNRNRRGRNITQAEDVAEAVVFAATVPSRSMVSEIDLRPTRP